MGCNASSVTGNDATLSGTSSDPSAGDRTRQDEIADHCLHCSNPVDGRIKFTDGSKVTGSERILPPGQLFEDESFPAAMTSLGYSEPVDPEFNNIQWKRPHEISDCPRLFVDGTSRSDVKQGLLGNCWFLSACAAVATRQELIERVIDPNQKLYGEGYQGVLVISFWQFGDWVKVYIDDRLPTRDGSLIYGSCTDTNEFWLSMVEKAFAKLHGSYEALGGGHALEAFVDLTGGIAEKIDVTPDLFNQLRMFFQHGAFITCSRKSDSRHRHQEELCSGDAKGLIEGHAYTITSVAVVRLLNGETVNLLRIRNPWGNSVEWKGDWNDKCLKWNQVATCDKERLRVAALADGEFWMNFQDFKNEFVDVTVATLGPDFNRDGLTDLPRQMEIIRGSWVKGLNAGGSRNNLENFSRNPQFMLNLRESADDSNNNNQEVGGKCSVLVALMQEHRRSNRDSQLSMLPISFFVYKAEKTGIRLGPDYFLCEKDVASSGDFTNAREVIVRADLSPGCYIIIPATFYPNSETDFVIRIFALVPFALTRVSD